MTRGNQREADRERAAARASKAPKGSGTGSKVGGSSGHEEALQAKIELKKKLAAEGKLKTKDRGENYVAQTKVASVVNPHTGKKDPKLAQSLAKKGKFA